MNLVLDQQTMIQNLKDYINEHFSSTSEFAKEYSLDTSNLSNMLNGKRKFTKRLAFELEDKLKLERGYFTRAKDESIKIPFMKIGNDNLTLQFDTAYFSIAKAALVQHTEFNNLFVIHSSIKIDREPLIKSIDKSQLLIFDLSQLELVNDKIYLIEYLGHLILRKFSASISGYTTDIPEIYATINDLTKVKVLARLMYVISVGVK